jgi:hypothetical protein
MFKNLVIIIPVEYPVYGGKCGRSSVDVLRAACLPGVMAMIWGHHHKLVPCFIFAIGILQKSHNYKAWQKKRILGKVTRFPRLRDFGIVPTFTELVVGKNLSFSENIGSVPVFLSTRIEKC